MALTEKMKVFAREYYINGGNGTEAYLAAYDTTNRVTASRQSFDLLKREDINQYIRTLNIQQENKAISEREKKRQILWDGIEKCTASGDHAAVARYMDILNKMDSEYININKTIEESQTNITSIDSDTLRRLSKAQ